MVAWFLRVGHATFRSRFAVKSMMNHLLVARSPHHATPHDLKVSLPAPTRPMQSAQSADRSPKCTGPCLPLRGYRPKTALHPPPPHPANDQRTRPGPLARLSDSGRVHRAYSHHCTHSGHHHAAMCSKLEQISPQNAHFLLQTTQPAQFSAHGDCATRKPLPLSRVCGAFRLRKAARALVKS